MAAVIDRISNSSKKNKKNGSQVKKWIINPSKENQRWRGRSVYSYEGASSLTFGIQTTDGAERVLGCSNDPLVLHNPSTNILSYSPPPPNHPLTRWHFPLPSSGFRAWNRGCGRVAVWPGGRVAGWPGGRVVRGR